MQLAFLAAASGVARAQDLSCNAGDVEVRSLRFEGNKAISDDELALRVTTTPSAVTRRKLHLWFGAKRCLNRAYLPRDLAAIEYFYLERGYYSAKADTVITRSGKGVRVTFRIDEGPVTVLDSLKVSGLNGISDSAAIVRNLRIKQGSPFSYSLLVADQDSITKRLRNAGYYRATTVPAFNRESLNATAEIIVVPGPRMKFGTPVLNVTPLAERQQQVPDAIVRRVMGIPPGSLYSDRAITEAQRSLFQLGVYRHVEVAPIIDSLQQPGDSLVLLGVRLSEDYMQRLDIESGWGSLDCGRLRAQYSNLNFLRSGRRFEVTGQASKIGYGLPLANDPSRDVCTWLAGVTSATGDPGQNALESDSAFSSKLHYYGGMSFRQPRLLGTLWVPTLSIYSERRGEYKAYLRTTKIGVDASAMRDVATRTQLRVGYTREFGQTDAPDAVLCALFSRCDDSSRVDIKKLATLGVASGSISRLRTDNLVSPTRGTVFRAEYRTSASTLLGTDPTLFFHKGSVETAFYTPLGGAKVLSFRLRGGAVGGVRGSFIPPQERLYAGGANSIRGFQQNELGALVYIARNDIDTLSAPLRYEVPDSSGFERVVPLGGNRLLVANLEYRVPDPFLFPNFLQYTFFVDAGNVWNTGKVPTLKWTPGVGLRMLTAIGPIQINFGYNQYPRPAGPMYYEDPNRIAPGAVRPDISPLYCVSPGNDIPLEVRDGVVQPPLIAVACPPTYQPVVRKRWYQKLAITFSLGPDF